MLPVPLQDTSRNMVIRIKTKMVTGDILSFKFSHQRRHVERQVADAVLGGEILRMKDDWRRDVTLELGPKPLKRGGGILLVALHLDRIDVVCGRNFRLREHEIDLHLVQGILAIVIEVKIELLPGRTKHLRNGILDDHSLVHFELSEENRLHDVGERGLVLRNALGQRLTTHSQNIITYSQYTFAKEKL